VEPFIERCGYSGSFGTYGGLTAALGLLAVPVFMYGKRIRGWTSRFARDDHTG